MRHYRNIEAAVGLHESVEIIYVVDGYEATLTADDGARVVCRCGGETVAEALCGLDAILGGALS